MNKKLVLGIIIAIIIIPIVFNKAASIIGAKIMAEMQKKPTPVDVAISEETEIYPQTESVGRIEAKYSVDVVARINGWLQKRYFQEGAFVKKGQTLFLIQPNEYAIAVQQAQAAVRQAQAALINSEKELRRAQELVKNDFVSKSYYDQALATRDQNKATLDVNKANLASAKLNLSYTKIASPVDGKVGKILITEGNLVNSQSGPLTKIVSTSPIYAYFNIKSEDYLQYMKKALDPKCCELSGMDVKIKLSDGTEYHEKGKLEFVNNEVDQTAGTIALRATFQNKDNLLVPGDFVNVVAISKSPTKVVVVPQIAVSDSTNGTFVWTINDKSQAKQKYVKIATKQYGDKWIVTEGLEPGEKVITKGFQRLRDGANVVIDEKAAAQAEEKQADEDKGKK
ncbi:MAG: efflux RND transporter periplasmic adaptor subunit [Clostridium sp.]|nr:efflux RND transporter periplasmic adaptor subunit [Clostridium sp.]